MKVAVNQMVDFAGTQQEVRTALVDAPLLTNAVAGDWGRGREAPDSVSAKELLDVVDICGFDATRRLSRDHRSRMGQFMTSQAVSKMLAAMFGPVPKAVRLLDAGAGVGSLTVAFVAEMICRPNGERPESIHAVAYEIESTLAGYLQETIALVCPCGHLNAAADSMIDGESFEVDMLSWCHIKTQNIMLHVG
jgi:hypothetical protein